MRGKTSKISNHVQNRNSIAWKKLCEYVDQVAESGTNEFVPREALGDELFAEIFTLPESISKLKKVTKVGLYGSNLKIIPPEIGSMESLEYFDPYTSYNLHWFPFEISKCKNLKDSRISTRALYGNYKNRMPFPKLDQTPVRYFGDTLKCSVCEKDISYETTNQVWITALVGTDMIPMLANLCSKECEDKLPRPPINYVQFPHKGGGHLLQPPNENELWQAKVAEWEKTQKENVNVHEPIDQARPEKAKKDVFKRPLLKLVRKLWEK